MLRKKKQLLLTIYWNPLKKELSMIITKNNEEAFRASRLCKPLTVTGEKLVTKKRDTNHKIEHPIYSWC